MPNDLLARKRPAHQTPVARHNAPVIILLTLCVHPRRAVLDNDIMHKAFLYAAARADAWSIGFYTIMPDHIHAFCRPASVPLVGVKKWSAYIKRIMTQESGAHGWRWQSDCWDRQMRDQKNYEERYAYVRNNPVRAGFVNRVEDWPYQGVINVLQW